MADEKKAAEPTTEPKPEVEPVPEVVYADPEPVLPYAVP